MKAHRDNRGARRVPRAARFQIRVWAARHFQTLVGSLGRLYQQPFSTFMTITVIGIALALPAGLQLLVLNGKNLGGRWDSAVDIAAYMKPGASEAETRELATEWGARSDVEAVQVVTAQQALTDFRASSGFGEAMEGLAENPLPHTIVVRPAMERMDAAQVELLKGALAAAPLVDLVQADSQWVRRFYAILDIVRRLVAVVALGFSLAVLVIIGNTIRLDIYSRREEIEIAKLIGAPDAFIRRPFLYSGAWYGLGGALASILLISVVLTLLQGPVSRLAGLYGSSFRLSGLGLLPSIALILTGAGLGWVGSWIAAARHIRRLEPI